MALGAGAGMWVSKVPLVASRDGCGATLADRFCNCGGGDRHGLPSSLSPSQEADLVAYLETL